MALEAFAALYTRDEHPAEFQQFQSGPIAAAALHSSAVLQLGVFDRECDIERITLRAVTPAGAGTVRFYVSPSTVAPTAGAGTAISAAEDITSTNLPANTARLVPLTGNRLNVPAGSVLFAVGAASVTNLANLFVTVRTQNRRYRSTDGGTKQFLDPPSY